MEPETSRYIFKNPFYHYQDQKRSISRCYLAWPYFFSIACIFLIASWATALTVPLPLSPWILKWCLQKIQPSWDVFSPPLTGPSSAVKPCPTCVSFSSPNFSNKISPLWVIHSAAADALQASRSSVFWSFIKARSDQTAKLVQDTTPWPNKRAAKEFWLIHSVASFGSGEEEW